MALSMKVKTNFGMEVDGYLRASIAGNAKGLSIQVIAYYVDASGNKNQISQISPGIMRGGYNFIPDLSGANFIQQAYDYLKTLDQFKTAKDC